MAKVINKDARNKRLGNKQMRNKLKKEMSNSLGNGEFLLWE